MQRINQIPVFSQDLSAAVRMMLQALADTSRSGALCISCTGAHGMVEASENPSFAAVLKGFYLNLPDGMPLVWLAKLKGHERAGRCYGPDVFSALMERTASLPYAHFFCGGKPGVADELAQEVTTRWSGVQVAGTYCPPFRPLTNQELQALADQINHSGASLVWVGLSTPKQEVFAARLAPLLSNVLLITVGAAFDFYTHKVKQAPRWIQQSGLEWFFRLLQEPRRLGPRYLKIVPKFALIALRSWWREPSKNQQA